MTKRLSLDRWVMLVAAVIAIAAVVTFFLRTQDATLSGTPPITGQVQNFAVAEQPRSGPETAWRTEKGEPVSLVEFRGRVVMLNFWATWCAPCIRELPSIDRLQAVLGGEDFAVIAVNIDRGGREVAAPFSARLGLKNLDLYLDADSTFSRAVGVNVMPTTIVYDRAGVERGRLEGAAEWDTPEALELLRWFIQERFE